MVWVGPGKYVVHGDLGDSNSTIKTEEAYHKLMKRWRFNEESMIEPSKQLLKQLNNFTDNTTKTDIKNTKKIVSKAQSKGKLTKKDVKEALINSKLCSENREKRMISNESHTSFEGNRLDRYLTYGAYDRKQWVTHGDSCDVCRKMSGEIVPIEKPFSNGQDIPHAHPGCDCTVDYLLVELPKRYNRQKAIDSIIGILDRSSGGHGSDSLEFVSTLPDGILKPMSKFMIRSGEMCHTLNIPHFKKISELSKVNWGSWAEADHFNGMRLGINRMLSDPSFTLLNSPKVELGTLAKNHVYYLDPDDRVEGILLHEFGHHVQYCNWKKDENPFDLTSSTYATFKGFGGYTDVDFDKAFPTEYSMANEHEWYAESFAIYINPKLRGHGYKPAMDLLDSMFKNDINGANKALDLIEKDVVKVRGW